MSDSYERPAAPAAPAPDDGSLPVEEVARASWEMQSAELGLGPPKIIEGAPPVTNWDDLLSEADITALPAVGPAPTGPVRIPPPRTPALPASGGVLPPSVPSREALPAPFPKDAEPSGPSEAELDSAANLPSIDGLEVLDPPTPSDPPVKPPEELLDVPSAESMLPPPPDSMVEREEALDAADAVAIERGSGVSDSIRSWIAGEPAGDTRDLPRDRTRPPRTTSPPRTGPAIAFAMEPEPESVPGTASPAPLQERVRELIGRTVDLVVEEVPPPEGDAPLKLPARYTWLSTLGEGGQGRVELVFDRDLGRQVALKTLHPSKKEERHLIEFYREARITGQLEHPNIMPVYDAGQVPDGRLYYTMRRMPGDNLHNVLSKLRRGDAEMLRTWDLSRLVQVLIQTCHGVGYAHERGVLHRDLKPANILLGSHGEVLVVDWGIARFVDPADGDVTDSIRRRLWSEAGDQRRERVRGSPPYMAPEQIKHPDQVGAPADVFCLGVILYETLTRHTPFGGHEVEEIVEALCHEKPVPPRERAPELAVPAELEEICLRALEKFPGHRYASASELAEALEGWQSGARRREAASRRLREADSMRARYQVLVGRKRGAESRLMEQRGPVGLETPEASDSRQLRNLEQRMDSLERAADGVFSEAVWALHRAVADDPENGQARSGLAELYGDRYAEAERQNLPRERAFFRAMLRQFDDGRWGRWLRAGAELEVTVLPEGNPLQLLRIDDVDGRLQPGERIAPNDNGTWSLPPGRYTLVPGTPQDLEAMPIPWHYPILLRRNERRRVELDLRGANRGSEQFCFVPGGPTLLGGDDRAPGSGPEREVDLPPFAIARHPVTVGAYARFLNWIAREDAAESRIRTPWNWPEQLRRGETRPVTQIARDDAERYSKWVSKLTRVTVRLPTADEWEKAARGADGRAYPWGDRFEPGACASLHSCDPTSPPPSTGRHPLDRSPFGMEDGAGLVWEWTSTHVANRQVVVGGCWTSEADSCRLAARRAIKPGAQLPQVGFRVLYELG